MINGRIEVAVACAIAANQQVAHGIERVGGGCATGNWRQIAIDIERNGTRRPVTGSSNKVPLTIIDARATIEELSGPDQQLWRTITQIEDPTIRHFGSLVDQESVFV